MILKKNCIETLAKALNATELSLVDARIRDKFLRDLAEHEKVFLEDREKIYAKHANKDKDGNAIITDNKYTFPPESVGQLTEDLAILLDETVEIEAPAKLKEFLENSPYKPKPGEVELIDKVITAI